MKSDFHLTMTNRSDFSEEELAAIAIAFDRKALPAIKRIKRALEKEFGAEYELMHTNGARTIID